MPPTHGFSDVTVSHESYASTDGHSASLSRNEASICGSQPDFYYCQTVAVFLCGRSLWGEDGFVVYNCCWCSAAQSFSGSSPVDSRPYFTVSDSRLPFSSPPTTRMEVEVLDPTSTWDSLGWVRVRVTLRLAFYVNLFVLAPSPLRLTARIFFSLSIELLRS
jgi:hypothetical protein